jgi:hypothetical protein
MTERRADQEEIGAAIRATVSEVGAPSGLRRRVEGQRRARGARRVATPRLAAGLVSAVAVAVVALVLIGRPGAGPTVADAASAALAPATAPAPARDRRHPWLLGAAVDGVAFPHWRERFGWRATGLRRMRLRGRPATAVVYRGPAGERLGYVIVSGAALRIPAPARVVTRGGVRFAVLGRGDAVVVTWRRAGNTCVVAARGVPAARLLTLAVWDGSTYEKAA